jgi:two-component system, response regulator
MAEFRFLGSLDKTVALKLLVASSQNSQLLSARDIFIASLLKKNNSVGKVFLLVVVTVFEPQNLGSRTNWISIKPMRIQEIKVMLVEDNPEDVAFTRIMLRKNKLDRHLVVAKNGKMAIQALEHLAEDESKTPDLLLLDINLPDISGIDLLTRLKGDSRFAKIPVVMLTGSNVDDDIQRSYDLGASTYLVKPISRDALMLVIQNLFDSPSED